MSRRQMLTGLGMAGAAGVSAGLLAVPAVAAPSAAAHPGATAAGRHPHTTPGGISTIASPMIVGHRYLSAAMFDFVPENAAAQIRWGGSGVYPTAAATNLWTSMEIPPGAQVFDIEWYVLNNSGSDVPLLGRVWQAGDGTMGITIADGVVHSSNGGVTATRVVVPSTSNGPFPTGTKLMLAVPLPTSGTAQVNGVRVGFTNAPMSTALRPTPLRVYNSTTSGPRLPLKSGQVRKIPLSAHLPAGANGALVAITAVSTHGHGQLLVGSSTSTAKIPAARWARTGDVATVHAESALGSDRSVTVASYTGSGTTHFLVDLLGYLV